MRAEKRIKAYERLEVVEEPCSKCGLPRRKVKGNLTEWLFATNNERCLCQSRARRTQGNSQPQIDATPAVVVSDGENQSSTVVDGLKLSDAFDDGADIVGLVLADRYEITARLGSGGMATIYKAHHKLIDRTQALKILHSQFVGDPGKLQRFNVEAKAASQLRHINLVSVTDFGLTPNNQPFIVMDFADGRSLQDYLDEAGPLTLPDFVDVFDQVCQGLAYAHSKGVIHRDIKPSNIMISKSPQSTSCVKIVDFGIAKIMPTNQGAAQHLTQTGEVFGSPYYMSPEQCRGASVDARSDIYSLGCVMFEAVTGILPRQGENAILTLYKHMTEDALPVSSVRPDLNIPMELEMIIAKCLEREPEQRFQTIDELKNALITFRFHQKLPASVRSKLEDRPRKRLELPSKNARVQLLGGLLLIALGFVLSHAVEHFTTRSAPPVMGEDWVYGRMGVVSRYPIQPGVWTSRSSAGQNFSIIVRRGQNSKLEVSLDLEDSGDSGGSSLPGRVDWVDNNIYSVTFASGNQSITAQLMQWGDQLIWLQESGSASDLAPTACVLELSKDRSAGEVK